MLEDGRCEMCKYRPLEERFPVEFRQWVENLTRIWSWQRVGFHPDELQHIEWEALVAIDAHFELKRAEAQAKAMGAS